MRLYVVLVLRQFTMLPEVDSVFSNKLAANNRRLDLMADDDVRLVRIDESELDAFWEE